MINTPRLPKLLSLFASVLVNLTAANGAFAATELKVSGFIYHDQNNNGTMDSSEQGIAGVAVSNGIDVNVSDGDGRYEITLNHGQTLFVIKPSHFDLPADSDGFHTAYFNYFPEGTIETEYQGLQPTAAPDQPLNFGLQTSDTGDSFKVAMLGDLQMRIQEEINYTNRLLTPELYQRDDLEFAVMLGDIADDNLNILGGTRQITKWFNMPTYPVFGNHDRNMELPWQNNFTSTFNHQFGPDYYAVNYGKVHFLMLNTVQPSDQGHYRARLSEQQLRFIENDLQHVPDDHLIVFSQHIPIYTIENADELMALVNDRQHVLAVSGHRHILEQQFVPYGQGLEMHEVVAGAVCGLWWDGERDWKGIPVAVMGGGAPKGYYVFSFEGNQYQMAYKAMELPAEKQLNIWVWQQDRGDWSMQQPKGFKGNEVLANVFAGSAKTNVMMRVDKGKWQPMKKVMQQDPYIARIIRHEQEKIFPTKGQIPSGLKTEPSRHMWLGYYPENLALGSHMVEVKAQDEFGLDAYEVSFFTIGSFD
ncbi:hypothetical protein GCM10011369_13070 [Neiella marina]|uniref:Metallophosphoesterase n=1 Tax=Neiella marina TaxID=508461 RepID=A0A8J2U3U3_9GAMM|nr:calcineurin-like phosphoesterase family protein [Neiella marina]GGA72683.1 hypothetical protein GCM10011369_13070 [Neiella marina]